MDQPLYISYGLRLVYEGKSVAEAYDSSMGDKGLTDHLIFLRLLDVSVL